MFKQVFHTVSEGAEENEGRKIHSVIKTSLKTGGLPDGLLVHWYGPLFEGRWCPKLHDHLTSALAA